MTQINFIQFENIVFIESTYKKAFSIIECKEFQVNSAKFISNNQKIKETYLKNNLDLGTAIYISNVFNVSIQFFVVFKCMSDVMTTGLAALFYGNSNRKIEMLINNSFFLENQVFYWYKIQQGGNAIYINCIDLSEIRIISCSFIKNEINILAESYIELVGAAAIRSIGSGESIYIERCNFFNQTTSHLSSCFHFQGRSLNISRTNIILRN